jgi:transcriptional regulator with XRE-family HTH domain
MMAEKKSNTANYNMDPKFLSLMENEVSRVKQRKIPIARAFEEIAERTGLKVNTVRNYYYRYINDTNFHTKQEQPFVKAGFSKGETMRLISKMLEIQGQGLSVRAASSRLAKGNQKILLRNQNKYRNTIAKERELVEEVIQELEEKSIIHMNPYTKKVFVPHQVQKQQDESQNQQVTQQSLVEMLGGLTQNLEILEKGKTHQLFKNLFELSKLAVLATEKQNSQTFREDQVVDLEAQLREASTTKLLQKQRIESLETQIRQLTGELSILREISGSFLNLSQTEKITHLPDYVHQLNGYIAKN